MSENRGDSILGAIFTFIFLFVVISLTVWIVIGVCIGLFFGLRWLYRNYPDALQSAIRIVVLLLVVGFAWGLHHSYVLKHEAQYGTSAYEQKDYTAALDHWESGADSEDVESMFLLGSLYDKGEGVKQNYGAAANWYKEALATMDDPPWWDSRNYDTPTDTIKEGYYRLGKLYENGTGVGKDPDRAKELYEKSGTPLAMVGIGTYLYMQLDDKPPENWDTKIITEIIGDLGKRADANSGLGFRMMGTLLQTMKNRVGYLWNNQDRLNLVTLIASTVADLDAYQKRHGNLKKKGGHVTETDLFRAAASFGDIHSMKHLFHPLGDSEFGRLSRSLASNSIDDPMNTLKRLRNDFIRSTLKTE